MSEIAEVRAREVLDSRGWPTVEAEVRLKGGEAGRAAVPSGASTGRHEAVEVRDGDASRYRGRGVTRAVANVEGEIRTALVGLDAADQRRVDERLCEVDGTEDKGRLGANATLAASMAVARAGAAAAGAPLYRWLAALYRPPGRDGSAGPLPVPLMNVVNGGVHAANDLDIQEFMVLPVGQGSFREALRAGAEVYHALVGVVAGKGMSTAVGDEGGVAPDLGSNREALDLLMEAVEAAGYRAGEDVLLALDCAATEVWEGSEGRYRLESGGEAGAYGPSEMIDLYEEWTGRYPLVSIEDGLAEDDWDGWRELTSRLGSRVQLVGDDLFVTNVKRLRRGVERGVANAVLVKPNQIGTVSETLGTVREAAEAGYAAIISHRSGETEDTFIADLAVACGCGQIKTGAPCRSERVAKYNRLLRIEEELGADARYGGADGWS